MCYLVELSDFNEYDCILSVCRCYAFVRQITARKNCTRWFLVTFFVLPCWIMFLGFGLTAFWAANCPRKDIVFSTFSSATTKCNQTAVSISFSCFFSCGLSSFSFFYLVMFPTVSDSFSSECSSSYSISLVLDIKLKIWNWLKTFGLRVLERISRKWKEKRN
jgi:hypothetical protein